MSLFAPSLCCAFPVNGHRHASPGRRHRYGLAIGSLWECSHSAEYHVDGLRLDATDTIKDDSALHILAELNAAIAQAAVNLHRHIHLVAEDSVNRASIVKTHSHGGLGFWSVG